MKNIKFKTFCLFFFINYSKAIELNHQYLENTYGAENLKDITNMNLDKKGFTSVNSNAFKGLVKI